MTHDEATALSARHNREHPDRAAYRWFARRDSASGEWSVARARLPAAVRRDPLVESTGTPEPAPPLNPTELPGGVSPWAAGGG
jgi:hypothetical protein